MFDRLIQGIFIIMPKDSQKCLLTSNIKRLISLQFNQIFQQISNEKMLLFLESLFHQLFSLESLFHQLKGLKYYHGMIPTNQIHKNNKLTQKYLFPLFGLQKNVSRNMLLILNMGIIHENIVYPIPLGIWKAISCGNDVQLRINGSLEQFHKFYTKYRNYAFRYLYYWECQINTHTKHDLNALQYSYGNAPNTT